MSERLRSERHAALVADTAVTLSSWRPEISIGRRARLPGSQFPSSPGRASACSRRKIVQHRLRQEPVQALHRLRAAHLGLPVARAAREPVGGFVRVPQPQRFAARSSMSRASMISSQLYWARQVDDLLVVTGQNG